MEPDFKALAEAWIEKDPRTLNLDEERRAKLVERIATAFASRWSHTQEEEKEIGLVVNVDRDLLSPEDGSMEDTLSKLTDFVQERIEQGDLVEPEPEG